MRPNRADVVANLERNSNWKVTKPTSMRKNGGRWWNSNKEQKNRVNANSSLWSAERDGRTGWTDGQYSTHTESNKDKFNKSKRQYADRPGDYSWPMQQKIDWTAGEHKRQQKRQMRHQSRLSVNKNQEEQICHRVPCKVSKSKNESRLDDRPPFGWSEFTLNALSS